MQDEALQAAFEIKTECDEISRRLLRWHWEQKPGSHSLDALLRHIAQRQKESPDYYDRMPDLSGKTSWQQLDTTLCMRVLLDPEKDAAKPLDLLGNTRHPGAARRACNAVRTARNEAAHAADAQDAAQAALLFNEEPGRRVCGHRLPGKRAGPVLPGGRELSGAVRCPESGPPGRQHPRAEQSGEACGPYRQQDVGRESVEQQPHGCPQAQRPGTPQPQKEAHREQDHPDPAAGGAGAGPAAAGTAHGCPVRAARRNSKKELDSACQMQADLCRTAKNWGCRCNKTGHCTPCGTVQAGL